MKSEGIVAGNEFLQHHVKRLGYYIPVSVEEFHGLLDFHCHTSQNSGTHDNPGQSIVGLETPHRMKLKGSELPKWMTDRIFCHMKSDTGLAVSNIDNDQQSFPSLLRSVRSMSECVALIVQRLVDKVARAMGIPGHDIDTSKPLYEYGVDSLLAIEMRNWASKECESDVAVFEIMDEVSFTAVGGIIAKKSKLCAAA
jgi:hypothetical protein